MEPGASSREITMNFSAEAWTFPLASLAIIATYLFLLAWRPRRRARHAHAELRSAWFDAVTEQPGTELLAVQTLRNSVMTATLIASSAALGLTGAISLTAPSLHEALGTVTSASQLKPRVAMELALLTLLMTTLALNIMAIRNYTHAGFVLGMPVSSPARRRWTGLGRLHVRSAGMLFGWGPRCMVLAASILVSLVHAWVGVVATLFVTAALWRLEGHGRLPQRARPIAAGRRLD